MPTVEAKLARAEARIKRLERYVVILLAIVVFAAAAGPAALIYASSQIAENTVVRITCDNYRNNVAQLEALGALEERLGIPSDFVIPPLPEECR